MVGSQTPPVCYKVKQMDFFYRKVPIVMQNENGPCPLLALANVLLLRNQVHLPLNTPEVAQDKLISLVAGYLLDSNNEERMAKLEASEEYRANVQQNIADAIALLPKLATGVDVNVRFDHIRAFEFTHDVAIFDLLDIRLVHGWLIDPQDVVTRKAIDGQSYNEVVATLVNTLGDETPTHLRTSHSRNASFTSARSASLQAAYPPAQLPSGNPSAQLPVDNPPLQAQSTSPTTGTAHAPPVIATGPPESSASADKLEASMAGLSLDPENSEELQQALALSLDSSDARGDSNSKPLEDTASSAAPNHPSTSEGATSSSAAWTLVPHPDVPSALEEPALSSAAAEVASSSAAAGSSSAAAATIQGVDHQSTSSAGLPGTANLPSATIPLDAAPESDVPIAYDDLALKKGKMKAFVDVDPDEYYEQQAGSSGGSPGEAGPSAVLLDPARSGPSSAVVPEALPLEPAEQAVQPATMKPSLPAPLKPLPSAVAEVKRFQQSEQRARELQRANVMQAFLEATSSQLTHHGLLSLQQDLRSNELAVLFRNNHFNTIFYHNGDIYILVTDQGYLFEKDVVWEKLCDVNGNTEFVKGDFERFAGSPPKGDVSAAADLAQAAFASVVPPRHSVPESGSADPDADFALALKLQDQENERNQQFLQQQQQGQQQQQQQRAQYTVNPLQQQQQQQQHWGQADKKQKQPKKPPKGASGGKNKDEKCSIM